MPIDLKEVSDYLGIDLGQAESLDAFRDQFDGTFQKREEARTFTGRLLSSNRTALTKLAKEYELTDAIDPEALKSTDKPWEMTRSLFDAFKSKAEARVAELQEQLSKGGTAAQEEWAKKLEAKDKRVKDLETALQAAQREFEGFKGEVTKKEQDRVLGSYWEESVKALKLDPSVDELRKEGFFTRIRSAYALKLDEEGKPGTYTTDGERVKDSKKHGAYKELAAIMQEEADKLGLTPKNPGGGKPAPALKPTVVPPQRQGAQPQPAGAGFKRPVNPRAWG